MVISKKKDAWPPPTENGLISCHTVVQVQGESRKSQSTEGVGKRKRVSEKKGVTHSPSRIRGTFALNDISCGQWLEALEGMMVDHTKGREKSWFWDEAKKDVAESFYVRLTSVGVSPQKVCRATCEKSKTKDARTL